MFAGKDKEESANAFHLSISQMWCMCAKISYRFFGRGVDLKSRANALLDVGKQNVFSCLQNILVPIPLDLC